MHRRQRETKLCQNEIGRGDKHKRQDVTTGERCTGSKIDWRWGSAGGGVDAGIVLQNPLLFEIFVRSVLSIHSPARAASGGAQNARFV